MSESVRVGECGPERGEICTDFEVHQVLYLPRNLHFKVHQALCLPRNLHFEVHKVLRLPRNLLHKVLCLPRRFTKCCACHEICTSRFTKFCACREICTSRFTQCCTCHEICTSRLTKCCACHEICTSRFTKRCTCHGICTSRVTECCGNEPHVQKSRFTAPVTKSELLNDHHVQSDAPATKPAFRTRTSPICHEKSALEHQNTRFPLRLPPRKVTTVPKCARRHNESAVARSTRRGPPDSASLRSRNAHGRCREA